MPFYFTMYFFYFLFLTRHFYLFISLCIFLLFISHKAFLTFIFVNLLSLYYFFEISRGGGSSLSFLRYLEFFYLKLNINHSGFNIKSIPIRSIITPPKRWEYLLYFVDIADIFMVNIAIKNTIKSSIRKKKI